jgi:hypothetical protein
VTAFLSVMKISRKSRGVAASMLRVVADQDIELRIENYGNANGVAEQVDGSYYRFHCICAARFRESADRIIRQGTSLAMLAGRGGQPSDDFDAHLRWAAQSSARGIADAISGEIGHSTHVIMLVGRPN